jgi:hypothetical protein
MVDALESGHTLLEFSAEAVTAWAAVGTLAIAIIAACIALYAAIIALRQIREAREIGWNTDAQEAYRSYLQVCVNNPELASPNYQEIKQNALKLEKYGWFVAYLLSAAEKILAVTVDEAEWIYTIRLNIRYHKKYLSDKEGFSDDDFWCYSVDLRKLIFKETRRQFEKRLEVDRSVHRTGHLEKH